MYSIAFITIYNRCVLKTNCKYYSFDFKTNETCLNRENNTQTYSRSGFYSKKLVSRPISLT